MGVEAVQLVHEGLKKSGSKLGSPEGAPLRAALSNGSPSFPVVSRSPQNVSIAKTNLIWRNTSKNLPPNPQLLNLLPQLGCLCPPKASSSSHGPFLMSPAVSERTTLVLTMPKGGWLHVIFQNALKPTFLSSRSSRSFFLCVYFSPS